MISITSDLSSTLIAISDSLKNGESIDPFTLIKPINEYLASESHRTNFQVDQHGVVTMVKGKKELKLCNTFVLPIRDKIIHYSDYDERYLEVACLLKGTWHHPICLSPSQLRNDQDWMRKELGFKSIIWGDYSFIVEYINIICSLIPTVHEYAYVGWSKTHSDIYITGSGAIGNKKRLEITSHPSIERFELPEPKVEKHTAVKTVIDTFLEVGTHDFTYTATSFMFLSCYKSLLNHSPQVPEFVYYVYGPTGSRKTASSKVFFNAFNDWEYAPINFTATKPAIELKRTVWRDTVLFIDDIPPAVNPKEQNELLSKLEAIFRSVGDSIGRQKMVTPNQSTEMRSQGMTAITAEDLYVKSASSLARGFFVKVDSNTIRLDKLSAAQRLRNHYSATIYFFIEDISKDVNSFTKQVADLFKKNERYFAMRHENAHGRQISSAAWLQTSFQIFLEFALASDAVNEYEIDEMLQENEEILHQKLSEMIKRNQSNEEVELFVRAIKELLASKSLSLADINLKGRAKVAELSPSDPKALGYRDAEFIYLLSDSVYSRVCTYYSKQNKSFPVTQETLWGSLRNKNLLIPDGNKDGTRTVRITVNGDRISVIRLNRTLYENWGEEPYDFDIESKPGILAGKLNYR